MLLGCLSLGSAGLPYAAKREAMIRAECNASLGGAIALTPQEAAADRVLRAAKAEAYSSDPFLASRSFFQTQRQINASKLFTLLQPLPKGAALHLHFDSMLDTRWFLPVTYESNCFVCWPSTAALPVSFRFLTNATAGPTCEAGWQRMSTLRATTRNVTALDELVYEALSLPPASKQAYPDVDSAWRKFQALFGVVGGLLNYLPVYRRYVAAVMDRFVDDNVQRLELRGGLLSNITYTLDQVEQTAEFAVQLWLDTAASRKLNIAFIYSALRSQPPEAIALELRRAKELKAAFPSKVIGFDLVGQEDPGRPLVDFAAMLQAAASPRAGPPLPYVFHAGETKYFGAKADVNLYDALLLNTSRIGHGFALRNHPELRRAVRERGIGIEVCPLSNQVLGLVDDLRNHPLASFIAEALPVVISSDDPGFWGATAVNYDWWVAFVVAGEACAGIGLLKQLAINSIEQSLLTKGERAAVMSEWQRRWGQYVDWVVSQAK